MENIISKNLINELTSEEKVSLTTGKGCWQTAFVERLNVASVTVSDGPVGLRKENGRETVPSVCFPSVAKLACSFDTALVQKVGAAIGEQCRAEGVNVLLAPGLNIKRDPRCGRNFEYFSEDPLLTAELANAYIAGVKSQGVGVCVKHFAANNQEYGRMTSDSIVDEKALREIYLNAFERVIKKSSPEMVMCSYNKLNGEYCSQNRRLLTDILRTEWGFKGVTVSDWGATDDRVKGIAAGLDLEMPEGDTSFVLQALTDGRLNAEDLNKSVERVLDLSQKFANQSERIVDLDKQRELARKLSAETTVLVKNNCKLLPLKKNDKITVIGALAQNPVYQGEGSSKVNSVKSDNLLSALKQSGVEYEYFAGYDLNGSDNESLLEEARQAAVNGDKIVLVVGDKPDFEGGDRLRWSLPGNQLELIDAVTSANSNVVLVLQCGSSVNADFVHSVKAMLIDYYGGEQSGQALCDALYGDVCPTGRLAETWYSYLPKHSENYSKEYKRVLYSESIYVGYRYTTTADFPVAFPFGYGLGYGEIKWDKPVLTQKDSKKDKIAVNVVLTNTGEKDDAEVVQIYSTNLDNKDFCERKKLVAFSKVRLKAGETKNVSITVPFNELAHYNVEKGEFCINGGKYALTVGRDANDDRFVLNFDVDGENDTADNSEKYPCYYTVNEEFSPSPNQFLQLYGAQIDEVKQAVNVSTPLEEIKNGFVGKITVKKLTKACDDNYKRNVLALPLRAFVSKYLSKEMLYTLIDMLNGAVFKNLFKFYKQYIVCKKARKREEKLAKNGAR